MEIRNLSICITIKNRSRNYHDGVLYECFPDYLSNLKSILKNKENVELSVVDFDSQDLPLLNWLYGFNDSKLTIIYENLSDDFSRGKGLNSAFVNSTYDFVFFSDVDLVLTREFLLRGIQSLNQPNSCYFPIVTKLKIDKTIESKVIDGYGNFFMRREDFKSIGGFPEFNSWGGEDTIVFEKCSTTMNVIRDDKTEIIHNWHPGEFSHRHYKNPPSSDYFKYISAN